MSLLSSSRLVVAIHERGIDALHVRRGRLPRSPVTVLDRQRFDVAVAEPGAASGYVPWQRSLALLRDLPKTPGVSRLHLVLSNHFVRYQLLPWDSVVACRGAAQSLARARFQLAFGDAASNWQVTAEAPRFRSSCLAAAIDGELMATAKEMAAAAGWQIAGIRPHLLSALGRWRAGLRRHATQNAGWFAVFEPGRLTVLGSTQGSAASLHNIRLHAPEALMLTLQQCVMADRLKAALDGSVCLHAPGWSGHLAGLQPPVIRLDGPVGEGESPDGTASDFGQAMAWCGSV